MRILVTGGAGYIGSITTRILLDAGHDCIVIDSLERGHRWAVDARAAFIEGSVGDESLLAQVLPECDAVMHIAGLIEVAESQSHPEKYVRANVTEPTAMLEAMVAGGVEAIVFSSSAAVYGEPIQVPITETADTRPVNVYGETKLAFERILDEYAEKSLRSVRLRYFNVAGAMPDASLGEAHDPETHLIPRVLGAMLDGTESFTIFGNDYPTADGTCVRDYIHVLDLAKAHLLALERLHAKQEGGVFNLGNGSGFSNRQVVEVCAKVTGTLVEVEYGPRRAGDPAVLVASAEKAKADLGWEAERTNLEVIVSDAWRWHLARAGAGR